jgi:hypothetical protein
MLAPAPETSLGVPEAPQSAGPTPPATGPDPEYRGDTKLGAAGNNG